MNSATYNSVGMEECTQDYASSVAINKTLHNNCELTPVQQESCMFRAMVASYLPDTYKLAANEAYHHIIPCNMITTWLGVGRTALRIMQALWQEQTLLRNSNSCKLIVE